MEKATCSLFELQFQKREARRAIFKTVGKGLYWFYVTAPTIGLETGTTFPANRMLINNSRFPALEEIFPSPHWLLRLLGFGFVSLE